jgi:broad specificity phosphatase PhoE
MERVRLVVMRHGEREDEFCDEHFDGDTPLTARGKDSCREASKRLGAREMTVMTSPFRRTIESAEAVVGQGVEIGVDEQLGEVFGPQRIKVSHVVLGHPKSQAVCLPVFGETIEAATARFKAAFEKYCILALQQRKSYLLVTHDDAVAAVVHSLIGATVYRCDYSGWIQCALETEGRWEIVSSEGVEWLENLK